VASTKDRERKLARAKLDRQMARRAAQARTQRLVRARIGAGAAVLLIVAAFGFFTHWYGLTSPQKDTIINATCTWTPTPSASNSNIKATGEPPPAGMPTTGTETMTINTNQGAITAELDVTHAPCTAASFSFLASTKFFDNTPCQRLTTSGLYVLQCGDPSGTGSGGPAYTIPDENLPVNATPAPGSSPDPTTGAQAQVIYPAGTLAMANTGSPDTGGSQFFLVYKDTPLAPSYTVFGKITKGLDVVTKIAAGGVGTGGASATDGPPKLAVTINTMTVSPATSPLVLSGTPSDMPSSAPSSQS
jgi:peptidyl-prolyl cis-trans isomerase B (cyclophilin B)